MSTWILILVLGTAAPTRPVYAPSVAVTTQEFSSKVNCLTAVRDLLMQQQGKDSYISVHSYACVEK